MRHFALNRRSPPGWTRWWLRAAGIYNLAWGASVIVAPHWQFDAAGLARMQYPEIWQCVGMIVGVYGIGYLIAAQDSRRHWPIVLVGLLGKVFGPIGFAMSAARGSLPLSFGLTIVTNDLIWWVPFCLILWDAYRAERKQAWHAGEVRLVEDGLGQDRARQDRSAATSAS